MVKQPGDSAQHKHHYLLFFCLPSKIPPAGPPSSPKSAVIIMDATKTNLSISEALYHLIAMMLTLSQGFHSMPVPTDIPMCTASESAQYRLTFHGKWTQAAFPKQYPVYRPPAQWSNLIGKCRVKLLCAQIIFYKKQMWNRTDWLHNREPM